MTSDHDALALDVFRRQLLSLRAELAEVAETGHEAAQVVELDQTRVGRLSRMDAMQAQAMSAESERRCSQQLLLIESALRRIDDGDFGICTGCGEAIAENRLAANPTVLLCIECAREAER